MQVTLSHMCTNGPKIIYAQLVKFICTQQPDHGHCNHSYCYTGLLFGEFQQFLLLIPSFAWKWGFCAQVIIKGNKTVRKQAWMWRCSRICHKDVEVKILFLILKQLFRVRFYLRKTTWTVTNYMRRLMITGNLTFVYEHCMFCIIVYCIKYIYYCILHYN